MSEVFSASRTPAVDTTASIRHCPFHRYVHAPNTLPTLSAGRARIEIFVEFDEVHYRRPETPEGEA